VSNVTCVNKELRTGGRVTIIHRRRSPSSPSHWTWLSISVIQQILEDSSELSLQLKTK